MTKKVNCQLSTVNCWFRDHRGQSFIEAMVAITVIVTSVSSSLTLIQSSITASRIAGTHVVAANLAREGLEVVRSLRDGNWLAGRSFDVGLTDPAGKTTRPFLDTAAGTWTLSFIPTSLTSANAAVYLTREGVYVQADAQPTGSARSPYVRMVTLTHLCRDDSTGIERAAGGNDDCLGGAETLVGIGATTEVSWGTIGGGRQTIHAEERFYDWR